MMKILIIGSGGREHAITWKVAQSPRVTHVYVAPGNPGTATEPQTTNVPIDPLDINALIQFAQKESIALTIVGPEAPLVLGIVDAFKQAGLACLGPTRDAAQLEGSKKFCKDFLHRHHIPTAAYATFTDPIAAKSYLENKASFPIVIKADGLAAGKGVVIAATREEAIETVQSFLTNRTLGEAGHQIVIEEFLAGEEASFIVLTDGQHYHVLPTAQDHKARDEGDTGPNTGGMGAYSPAPVITETLKQRVLKEIIEPTIQQLAAEGMPYVGFLYAGLMITPDGSPKVLEFNCRLGDPETQVILMRLQSDFVTLCEAAVKQQLDTCTPQWDPRPSLGVVLAAGGYPAQYEKGYPITLPQTVPAQVKIFHAGTALKSNQLVTHGGRVFCVTALGETLQAAQKAAYATAADIQWESMFYRKDIGHRALR